MGTRRVRGSAKISDVEVVVDARVLIVEELTALRTAAAQTLQGAGCVVLCAPNLGDAAEVAALTGPDVVVVDERVILGAPREWRRARRDGRLKDLLVVATARHGEHRAELIARGAHCVVHGPVCDRELLKAIRWVLEVYGRRRAGAAGPDAAGGSGAAASA